MRSRSADFLPLTDLVFRILVTLADGERYGGSLGQALDEPGTPRVLPGHLYRTLDRMLEDGLIDERDQPARTQRSTATRGTQPTRFFRLTPFGRDVARAETDRLEALIARSRAGGLSRARR